MINNIQNLFVKYKINLDFKKEAELKVNSFFQKELGINLSREKIKIDIKNKKVKIINTNSSLRFYLINKMDKNNLIKFKKETNLDFLI